MVVTTETTRSQNQSDCIRGVTLTVNQLLSLKERWTRILDNLCLNGFGTFLSNSTLDQYFDWLEEAEGQRNGSPDFFDEISFKSGLTKLVLIDDGDWVLKIPFSNKKDHCKMEVRNYMEAVKEGFDNNFAATFFLMTYEGAPCYIMEKAECDETDIEDKYYDSLMETGAMSESDVYSCLGSMDSCTIVGELLELNYGRETFERFQDFLDKNGINDLHTGNVGFLRDLLVLIDYSGYHKHSFLY